MVDEKTIALAKRQNDALRKRFSTKYSNWNYQIQQLQQLQKFNSWFIFIYCTLSIMYAGLLIFGENAVKYSWVYKLTVISICIVFPFIISPVEMFFVNLFTFFTKTFFGDVYNRPDYEYGIDYTFVPTLSPF